MEQTQYTNEYQKPSKVNAVLIGGLVIGAISGVPGLSFINCCCCAGIIAGGAVAVLLYKKEIQNRELFYFESSDALILGILSGIVGAFVSTFISVLVYLAIGPIDVELLLTLLRKLIDRMESSGALPPGTMDEYLQDIEESLSRGLTLGKVLQELVLSLIVYPIFAMIGSLLMYGVGGRREREEKV
ncbi:MAG: hypothetical protein N3A63_03170 [Bacteroidetes bacterium]|nr:hypothetical protein [Bacteroidota bacterium]